MDYPISRAQELGLSNNRYHPGDPNGPVQASIDDPETRNAIIDEILAVQALSPDANYAADEDEFGQMAAALTTLFGQRLIKSGDSMTGPLGLHQGDDIPSANDLVPDDDNNGNLHQVTGDVQINSLHAGFPSPLILRFTGAPVLQHSAALVLPSAANIQAAAGDWAIFARNSGNWECLHYQKASGRAVVEADPCRVLLATASPFEATAVDFDLPVDDYDRFVIEWENLRSTIDGASFSMRVKGPADADFKDGGSDYKWWMSYASTSLSSNGDDAIHITGNHSANALDIDDIAANFCGHLTFVHPNHNTLRRHIFGWTVNDVSASQTYKSEFFGAVNQGPYDTVRFYLSAGTFGTDTRFRLYGLKSH